ncbi:MAG: nitroreductase family protein [Promethearchaeota archaeon]
MIKPEELLNFIKERRSIREFQDKDIPDSEIEMILEAGRWTPSASNRQPWEFIVIRDKEIIKKLGGVQRQKFWVHAPVHIAIIGKIKKNPNWYLIDTTLASMNMILMAWALKIGTCWVGAMDKEKASEILGLTEDEFLLTILPLGYIKGDIPKSYRTIMKRIKREI